MNRLNRACLITVLVVLFLAAEPIPGFSQTEEQPLQLPDAVKSEAAKQKPVTLKSPELPTDSAVGKEEKKTLPRAKFSLEVDTEALKLTDDIKVAKAQLKKHPNDPEAHFLMAAAYSRSPYLEQGFKHIKKVKKLLKEKKDFEFIDRTIKEYETLLESNPYDTVVLYRLAMGYYFKAYSLEKYPHHYKNGPTGSIDDFHQKAYDAISLVIKLNPNDTWARNYLGYLVSENGKDLSKAIAIWQESLAVDDTTNPGAYLLLSQAYLQRGDLQNALIYGAKGLEIKQAMGMTLP